MNYFVKSQYKEYINKIKRGNHTASAE